jgi:hypothetical protein
MSEFNGSLAKVGGVHTGEIRLAQVLKAVGTLGEEGVVGVVARAVVGDSPLKDGLLHCSPPLIVLQTIDIPQLQVLACSGGPSK